MKIANLIKSIGAAIVIGMAFVGCATTSVSGAYGLNNAPVESDFTVLGRVTVEMPSNNYGYTVLFEEAKKIYPDAQDLTNILVDEKVVDSKKNSESSYIMSALVIKYN